MEMGYALYPIVYQKQSNQALAQKITGMLLDLGKEQVQTMLNNASLMEERIDESVEVGSLKTEQSHGMWPQVLRTAGYFGEEPMEGSNAYNAPV